VVNSVAEARSPPARQCALDARAIVNP